MRSKPGQRVAEASLQVFIERLLRAGLVVILDRLVENAPVARLLQIRRHAHDQPERIVVESAANVVVAPLGQRLILVVRPAGWQLRRRQVQNPLPRPRRHHVHKSQQILVRVAEPQPPPDSRFIERRRPRHVERRHALIRVPDIHHPVGVNVRRIDLEDAQQAVPILAQPLEGRIGLLAVQVLRDHRLHPPLVDRLGARRIELLVHRILVVAQHKHHLPRLTRFQFQLYLVRPHRRPPMRNRVGQFTGFHGCRLVPAAVPAQKRFPLRVKPARLRTGKVGEMIAPLPVLRLVIDDAVFHLHLARIEVALEVGGVVLRIPQAKFDAREPGQRCPGRSPVRHRHLPDFQVVVQRYKVPRVRLDPAVRGPDHRVAHPVAAGVILQVVPRRLPRWRPELLRFVVAQVNIPPAQIQRHVVVPVAGQPPQPRVAIERVTPRSIGNDSEICLAAQVVDPRQRRIRLRDHVLAIAIVKISELHDACSLD